VKDSKPVIQSIVFGFGFRARSGKDLAVATIIAERGHLYKIKRYSFASELKRETNQAALACGGMEHLFVQPQEYVQENGNFISLPEHVVYDPDPPMDDPECGLGKQRLFLQWYGQEFRRSCNQSYWIDRVAQRISDERPEIALISDVRYRNEVAFVQEYGEAVKIVRPSLPQLSGAAAQHASETELASFEGWDDEILNDSDIETFKERVLFSFDMLMTTKPIQRFAEKL
jgi:hypothetical protein